MRASGPWLATVLRFLMKNHTLTHALNLLLHQTLPAHEHIIVVLDGGSNDATKDVIQEIQKKRDSDKHPELFLYDNPGRFVPHARNLALEKLPTSVTHILEFNGHIEVGENHLIDLKSTWNRLESEHPQIAALGCRAVGFESGRGKIESIIDSSLANPLVWGHGAICDVQSRRSDKCSSLCSSSALSNRIHRWLG